MIPRKYKPWPRAFTLFIPVNYKSPAAIDVVNEAIRLYEYIPQVKVPAVIK